MKVLMINGSPRKDGNTSIALGEIAKTLKNEGIESEIIHIGAKPVRGCIACNKCQENESLCVFNDDMCNTISAKFAEADALIVGSPTYYGQPNGALMALLQRAFYSNHANIEGKPAASVIVCRRGGSTASYQTMNMPFEMLNMPVVTSQYWNIVFGCLKGEANSDNEGLQTMRRLAKNMAWLLKSIKGANIPNNLYDEEWQGMNFIR